MYIENALLIKLTGTSAITALVNSKNINYIKAVQDVNKPFVVFQKISKTSAKTLSGAPTLYTVRIQFSIYDTTYKTCQDIAAAIKTAIDGFAGTMGGTGGVSVCGCFFDNETDLAYDPDSRLYGIAADYLIHYDE